MNKSRKSLIVKKDDKKQEAKRTKLDDLSQFKKFTHKKPQNIDDVCENMSCVGFNGFHYVKYDTLSNADKSKVEEEFLVMMVNFKYTPIQLGTMILEELYNEIDAK